MSINYDEHGNRIDPDTGRLLTAEEIAAEDNQNANADAAAAGRAPVAEVPFWQTAEQYYTPFQGPKMLDSQFQSVWSPVQGGDVWEKNMLAKQSLESRGATDKMNAANASNWATARSGLAMRGGIDQGARERLATNAAKTGIMGAQEQSRLDQMARLGIGAQGEQQRIDLEKYNNEGNLANSRWNISNAINQGNAQNIYNMERYKALMGGMASEKEAQATQNGGSWFCTASGMMDDPENVKDLMKLRHYCMRKNKDATRFYIYRCKPLLQKMEAAGYDENRNRNFVAMVLLLVREGKMEDAAKLYVETVRMMIEKYWPDCDDPVWKKGVVWGS